MKNTITARVGKNFLSKASRLFDSNLGTVFSELVQNSRRAGASRIELETTEQEVTDGRNSTLICFRDNGRGIQDMTALLELSESGWKVDIEEAEDPAGMGIFCLSNMEGVVRIRSGHQVVNLTKEVFAGLAEAEIENADESVEGVEIIFCAQSRKYEATEAFRRAVLYANIREVTVDGNATSSGQLVEENKPNVMTHEELGVRVVATHTVSFHSRSNQLRFNFHGIELTHTLAGSQEANELSELLSICDHTVNVELLHTKRLKMVLPARNAMIWSEDLRQFFVWVKAMLLRKLASKSHVLPHKWKLIASEVGVQLPDADLNSSLKFFPGHECPPSYREGDIAEWEAKPIYLMADNDPDDDLFCASHYTELFFTVRLARPNAEMVGYDSYDALPRTEMHIRVDGESVAELLNQCNDDFVVSSPIQVSLDDIAEVKAREFVVLSKEWECGDYDALNTNFVRVEGFDDVGAIEDFCAEKLFRPFQDYDSDSDETQEQYFRECARKDIAMRCSTPEAALRNWIESKLKDDLVSVYEYGSAWDTSLTIKITRECKGKPAEIEIICE
jgi:hypothetical protein